MGLRRHLCAGLLALGASITATPVHAQGRPLSEVQYSRSQATVRDIRIWNGRLAVQVVNRGWTELTRADGKAIAANTTLLKPDNELRAITLPVEEHFVEMLDVADEPGFSWALAKTHFGRALWRKATGGYWQAVTVPDMIRTSSQRLILVPTGEPKPILLGDGALYFDSTTKRNQGLDDSWDVQRFPPEPRHITLGGMGTHPKSALYSAGMLYLGFDAKWRESSGNSLFRLDMTKNEWTNLLPWDRQWAVVALERAADGGIWATTGEIQGMSKHGEIRHVVTDKVWAAIDSHSMTRTENWDLDPAAPMDMQFDTQGRVLLLTGEYGVIRSTGRSGFGEPRWDRLMARELWDQYVFVTSLMLVAQRYLLIGTVDSGLLVWDLQTQVHWRIATI